MHNKEEFLQKYTRHLNEKQQVAVQAVNGPVLLLAVPGSGKTTVLVYRLGYMLFCEGIAPENILTLTYTVAATNDMSRRFEAVFGSEKIRNLEFRTINGICAKIIAKYGQMIGKAPFELITDEKAVIKVLTDILVNNLSEYPTESDVKAARTLITHCKNMLLGNDEIKELGEQENLPLCEIFEQYNAYLKQNRLMDYDDQMIYAYKLLQNSKELLDFYKQKYRYICVDEAQDTSKIQHIIIGLLAGENGNLFMVGDEDQSIYGFRAAYPEALLNFEKDHPKAKVLIMDQNYRSNSKIVYGADNFIQHNRDRHEKHMIPTKAPGMDINYINLNKRANQYNYLLKVASSCTNETAVLYRDNESALPLIDMLERAQIPYRIKSVDMAFFTHRVVTDVTNIIRFALNPYDTELFMRIYFKCKTYLKKNQAIELCRISENRGIQVLDALDYMSGLSAMTLKMSRSLQTHLRNMLSEAPALAFYRIETPLGYSEYLERNSISPNKLFILKMLSYSEASLSGFLSRLEYLKEMISEKEADYSCKFILSTIHSSKGLEYEQVYLMDVCDNVFPGNVIKDWKKATIQEKKTFEEERRLFYVGMTRAKENLNIFKMDDSPSCLVKEIKAPVKSRDIKAEAKSGTSKFADSKAKSKIKPIAYKSRNNDFKCDFEPIIGQRIVQVTYGSGTITDVSYIGGTARTFIVSFDTGIEKKFAFPIAFKTGMKFEDDI